MMEQSFENSEDLIRMRQLLSDQKEHLDLPEQSKPADPREKVFDALPPPVLSSKKTNKAAIPKRPPRNDIFRSEDGPYPGLQVGKKVSEL